MHHPSLRKCLPEILLNTSFITQDKRTQNCRGLGIEMGSEEGTNVSSEPFDAVLKRVSSCANPLNSSIVPKKCRQIDIATGKIPLIIKVSRSIEIARRTEFEGDPQFVPVAPRSRERTDSE